jgi:hypothetical protein
MSPSLPPHILKNCCSIPILINRTKAFSTQVCGSFSRFADFASASSIKTHIRSSAAPNSTSSPCLYALNTMPFWQTVIGTTHPRSIALSRNRDISLSVLISWSACEIMLCRSVSEYPIDSRLMILRHSTWLNTSLPNCNTKFLARSSFVSYRFTKGF